jgi:hypothetical protein
VGPWCDGPLRGLERGASELAVAEIYIYNGVTSIVITL